MELPIFKIRASAAGELLTGNIGLTEIQEAKLQELTDRANGIGKPLTPNMMVELSQLGLKKQNPDLPETVKTLCRNWIKEQLYGRKKDLKSKQMIKGNMMENDAIEFVSGIEGYGMVYKNDQWFESEYMTGTPDLLLTKSVDDIKCSWDCFTFPLFAKYAQPGHEEQVQVYMHLTGRKEANVHYCLMNAPEILIDQAARKLAYDLGEPDVTMDIWQQVADQMNYDHLPVNLRHKKFSFSYDESIINEIIYRVKLCRVFITSELTKINISSPQN